MKQYLKKTSWSPYAVGVGIGMLTWVTFLLMLKAPGVSTTFVRFYGFLAGLLSFEHVLATPYLAKYVAFKPVFQWQFAFVIGIFIGAWISATLSGVTFSFIPHLWGKNFGFSTKLRFVATVVGGFLVLFGARLAGGCTSGHGISGGLQLATTGWLFLCVWFVAGSLAAFMLYKKH